MSRLKALLKLLPKSTPLVDVHETVLSALSDESKDALLLKISGKGLDKEIAAAFLNVITSEDGIKLRIAEKHLTHLRNYFALLGSESALIQYNDYISVLVDHHDKQCAGNLVRLLVYFMRSSNVLGFSKLRQAISDGLPVVISQLWSAGKCGEACYLAKYLAYVLIAEEAYLDNSSSISYDSLNEHMGKFLKDSPVLNVLMVLLNKPVNKDSLSISNLEKLASDSDIDMCMRNQICELVLDHKSTLLSRLHSDQSRSLLTFVLKEYINRSELAVVLKSFVDDSDLLGNLDSVWQLLASSMLILVTEELSELRANRDASVWIGRISAVLASAESDHIGSLRLVLKELITHIGLTESVFQKVIAGRITKTVAAAFSCIPFELFSDESRDLFAVVYVALGLVYCRTENLVFVECMRALSKLTRLGSTVFESAKETRNVLSVFYEHWVVATKLCDEDTVALLRDSIITILGSTHISSGDKDVLAKYMDVEASDYNSNIIRLAAFFKSSPWRRISALTENGREQVLGKVQIYISAVIGSIDPKNTELLFESSERWSYVFSIFDTMTKEDRVAHIKNILTKKQRKLLFRYALGLLDGTLPFDDKNCSIILRRAVLFFVNVVPSFELGEDASFSCILNWNCVLRVHASDSKLSQLILERASADKVVELFDSYSEVHENSSKYNLECVLALASELMKPRMLPYAEKLLAPISVLFDAGVLHKCGSVLAFAANVVKVFCSDSHKQQLVNLALTVAGCFDVKPTDIAQMGFMDELLYNALRYASSCVNNDQCALVNLLITKHFRCVQIAAKGKLNIAPDEIERLVFGCARIAFQLTQHAGHYSKIVATLISETIMDHQHIELAMMKLQTINDRNSAALLATTLPPVQQRQYSRVFPAMKKTEERIL